MPTIIYDGSGLGWVRDPLEWSPTRSTPLLGSATLDPGLSAWGLSGAGASSVDVIHLLRLTNRPSGQILSLSVFLD
jgi:hypothetical protein